MNRWILRGLATAGCAAGWWLLTAAPAHADAPTTITAQHAESGTLPGIRLDRPLLRIGTDIRTTIPTARTTATVKKDRPRTTGGAATARVRVAVTGDRTRTTTGGAATARPNPDRAARRPVADTKAAVTLDRGGLDVCLNTAVFGTTTSCGTEPTTRPHTAGNNLELCLTAAVGGTAGCGTEPGDRSESGAGTTTEPATLDACLAVGVLGDAASCGHGTTTPSGIGNSTPDSAIPSEGVDACLAVGSDGCDSPAGTGVSPAGNDGGNAAIQGGRDVLAVFGGALTGGIAGLRRTAELALTGPALAGIALLLMALGFLLLVGTRRRTA